MSLGWKMLCFRNEQRAGWQRGGEKPVHTCQGPDGGEEDEIEWSRATGVRAGTCCSRCIAARSRLQKRWVWLSYPREAAVFSRVLLRAGTSVRNFQLLPSRRHCVCFQPPPESPLVQCSPSSTSYCLKSVIGRGEPVMKIQRCSWCHICYRRLMEKKV